MNPQVPLLQIWQELLSEADEDNVRVRNVRYWSKIPPFSETGEIVGALDFVRVKAGRLLIRGWIFSLANKLDSLSLRVDGSPEGWHSVLATGLSRSDVLEVFPFAPQAAHSGFVIAIPSASLSNDRLASVNFRAGYLSGEVISGHFLPIEVTNAISG